MKKVLISAYKSVSPTGKRSRIGLAGMRLAIGRFDSTVKVWDIQTGQELLTLSGHGVTVWGIAFSLDGSFIATGSNDNTLRLWDVRTGEPLLTLPTAAPPFRISFTPDSTACRIHDQQRDPGLPPTPRGFICSGTNARDAFTYHTGMPAIFACGAVSDGTIGMDDTRVIVAFFKNQKSNLL